MRYNTTQTIQRFVFLLIFSFSSLTLWAQRERNYIYILDCSNSMVSDFHIWEPTLDFIQKDIDKLSDNTMVTIVPFQGTVYQNSVVHCTKKDFKWDKYKQSIYKYPETLTGTNICSAWDQAQQFVDVNKDNYIYLLTDGKDNKNPRPDGTENVCKRIRKWCDKVKNSRGYFVVLSEAATDPRIKKVVDECPYMYWTDASKKLNPFGSFEKNQYSYNTLEPQDISMPFSAEGEYKVKVQSMSDVFDLSIENDDVKSGKATLKVKPNGDMSLLPDYFDIPFVVTSDEIDILNDTMHLMVKNLPERSLRLPADQCDLGECCYYDAFLWVDAKMPDTLTFDIGPKFNDAAINANSRLKLQIKETTDLDSEELGQYELLYNGKKCDNGMIDVCAGSPAILNIVPNVSAKDGKHYFEIKVVERSIVNLESVNNEHPLDYEGSFRLDYDINMNPLKVFLIWMLIIIVAALFVWFLVIRPFMYPTIKVKSVQIESMPICKTIKVKGCRKVVFTNESHKQSFLNWLFTGEVKYAKEDCWDSQWYMLPTSKKDRVKAIGTSGYSMNPPGSTLKCMETVQFKSASTNKIISMTVKK
ncbi:MAG: VWA domain-containing protein [Bacteroidales bacterium]|nr:VWA domain-containing protein [Bacteroidales bacterium]